MLQEESGPDSEPLEKITGKITNEPKHNGGTHQTVEKKSDKSKKGHTALNGMNRAEPLLAVAKRS